MATPANVANSPSLASLVQANGIGAQTAALFGGSTSVASTLAALPANARSTVEANGVAGSVAASLTGNVPGTTPRSLGNTPMAASNNASGTTSTPKTLSEVAQGSNKVFVEDLLTALASKTSANQNLPILIPFWPSTQGAKIASGKDGFSGQYTRDQSVAGAILAQEDPTFKVSTDPDTGQTYRSAIKPLGADGKTLNLDFETGTLEGWKAEGNAWEGQPIKGDTVNARKPAERSNHAGQYWIGGYEKVGDKGTGTLTSAAFEVTHPWASFLVGGGTSEKKQRVEIVEEATGKIIRRAKDAKSGQNLRTRVKEGEIFSKVERND